MTLKLAPRPRERGGANSNYHLRHRQCPGKTPLREGFGLGKRHHAEEELLEIDDLDDTDVSRMGI